MPRRRRLDVNAAAANMSATNPAARPACSNTTVTSSADHCQLDDRAHGRDRQLALEAEREHARKDDREHDEPDRDQDAGHHPWADRP